MFCKLMKKNSPAYPFQLILENSIPLYYNKCSNKSNPFFKVKTNFSKNSFFLKYNGVNKIYVNIGHHSVCNVFKRVILKFIRPERNEVFNVDNSE